MTAQWQPHSESIRVTLTRTLMLAAVLGVALALSTGGLARWPVSTLLMLWPAVGGHLIELLFLNWLRPRLDATRAVQLTARLAVWFVGGVILAFGMVQTAKLLANPHPAQWPPWWIGGLAFIGIELVAHTLLRLRGQPNFFDGRA